MAVIGRRCHELRIPDETKTWRIVYYLADDAVVILEVFEKKTQQTPTAVIATCRQRLSRYRAITQTKDKP
jgi:phage-related protein